MKRPVTSLSKLRHQLAGVRWRWVLLADGLSNAEIAERLAISEHTVKSHVGNILAKLQLADRTQAAVYAWRQGIVWRG